MADIKLKLTKTDSTEYEINRFNGLTSIESLSQSTPDAKEIYYGVLANSGTIKINDAYGTIANMITNGTINASNVLSKLYFNGNQIQEHISNDSDYDSVNKEFSISLDNSLSNWNNISYPGYNYPIDEQQKNAYELLEDVFYNAGYIREDLTEWTLYKNASAFSGSFETNTIWVDTASGWEIMGLPLKVEANKQHTIKFKYQTTAYTALSGYSGIGAQVLSAEPTESDCSSISISTIQLENDGAQNYTGTITFTPTVSTVYFVFNFGYAADSQEISFVVWDFEIDGKSLYKALSKQIVYGTNNATGTVKEYLKNITIPYPYLESDTMFNTVNKFCELAQLTVYENDDGDIVFDSARPKITDTQKTNAIEIKATNQYKEFDRSIILKNKFQAVDFSEKKSNKEINYLTPIYTFETNIDNTTFYATSSIQSRTYTGTTDVTYTKALARVESYYCSGSFTIPKRSNMNLSKITKVYIKDDDNKDYTKHSITFDKREVTDGEITIETTSVTYPQFVTDMQDNSTPLNIDNYGFTITESTSSGEVGDLSATASRTDPGGTEVTTTATLTNGTSFTFTETDDNFTCTYNVLCGRLIASTGIQGHYYDRYGRNRFWGDVGNIDITKEIQKSISITVYGDIREITFEDSSVSDSTSSSTNTVSINTNELIQDGTIYYPTTTKISTLIKNNIKNDYSTGISNGTSTIGCANYYDSNNTIKKNWKQGEILEVGDIVKMYDSKNKIINYPDNNPMYWKVTGRTARYSGCPYVDLELQEVKAQVPKYNVIFISDGQTYATQTIDAMGTATRPTNPTKTNYEFVNWYTDSTYTTVFNFSSSIIANTTLYARFDPVTVTSTYDVSSNTSLTITRTSSEKIEATIGTITTATQLYYGDKLTFTVSTGLSSFNYVTIELNGSVRSSTSSSFTTTQTVSSNLTIKTYAQAWTKIYTATNFTSGIASWYDNVYTMTNYTDQGRTDDIKLVGDVEFNNTDSDGNYTQWHFIFGTTSPQNSLESYGYLPTSVSFDSIIEALPDKYTSDNNVKMNIPVVSSDGTLTISIWIQNINKAGMSSGESIDVYQLKNL